MSLHLPKPTPAYAKTVISLLRKTYTDWSRDKASRLAAALAFYTALSLAPLVMIVVVAIAGIFFGDEAARGGVVRELGGLLGTQGAAAIEAVLKAANSTSGGIAATIIGTVVLLVGASGVFSELQGALDTIWEVEPRPGRGWKGIVRERFFSFTMVLSVAFLLLVSLVLTAALSAAGAFFNHTFSAPPWVWQVVNQVVSLALTTALFSLIYKVVPDVEVPWRDVVVGAAVAAVLFTLGKIGIGIYLGRSTVVSAYGAAGSLVAILVWVYYSAQILFFGAELTQAYATLHGTRIAPSKNAVAAGTAESQLPEKSAIPPAPTPHAT